jgi:hypothetical protein
VFHNRLTETAELFYLILGYLMTREGLAWYRSLSHGVVRGCQLADADADVIDSLIRPLLEHFRLLLYRTESDAFYHAWKIHLTVLTFLPQEAAG